MYQSIKTNKESLLQLIRESNDHSMRIQVCASVFDHIEQQTGDSRASAFQWFVEQTQEEWCYEKEQKEQKEQKECVEITELLQQMGVPIAEEEISQVRQAQNKPFVTEREISSFNAKYRPLIESIINMLSLEGYSTSEYYNKLFDVLLKVCSPQTAAEKGLCLYNVIWDNRSPYFEVPKGILLGEDDFQDILNSIEPQLKKMMFILYLSHSQRVEKASQLVSVIDELDTIEAKAVFLAQLLKVSRKKVNQ